MRWLNEFLSKIRHHQPVMVWFAVTLFGLGLGNSSLGLAQTPSGADRQEFEFSARVIWKKDGKRSKAQLFVKGDRYRIEHLGGIQTELGNAGVTIVRLDEQKVWYVLSQRRMVVSVPLTSDYLLPFSVTLEGEISRSLVGDSMVHDEPAVLYEVVVKNRAGKTERYFQWVDPEREILVKLMSQERDWFVEYEHVVLSTQPEYFFEAPLGYRVIEAQEAQSPRG